MSESTEIDDVEWENVARRIFYECLATSSSSSSISSFTSLPSTTSRITVKTLVDFIRNNASGNSRNKFLLDELEKSIAEVSWDGQVNYTLFKKASRRWVMKIQNNGIQDGNNNISKDDSSDDFLGRSDDEKQNSVDSSDNDRDFGSLRASCGQSKTPRKLTTADFVDLLNVSSYSPSSDMTHGCAMSDTTPESADDADSGCGVAVGLGEVSQIDLRLRVRRFDEENALLREELVRAEELAAGLERQLENLRRKLEHAKEKCRQLERENDEHQEMLNEAEQKERDCRWALQKAEKERSLLTRKLEDAETERQQVVIFSTKLERCKKEKYDCMREFTVCQRELEEKQRECELLKEQLAQITEANKNLQESYDKTIQRLREKIQELKKEKFILHTPEVIGNSSDPICTTPPISYLHSYMQSTPYTDKGVKMHDSLYDELKASGFSLTNESRIRELEDDLCSYNEEIRYVIRQINNVMEQLCHTRSMPYVPDLNLEKSNEVKSSEISVLLDKISELSNTVNEIIWKPKVKDASTQLCADSFYTDERLSSQYGIPIFEDNLEFAREKSEREASREDSKLRLDGKFFARAFSMNSRLLGEYVEEVETSNEDENYRDINNFSSTVKGSLSAPLDIQEHTIIDPIVEELDRILECTNKSDEETTPLNSSPSKNPKYRCIYTCAQPSSNFRGIKIDDSSKDSTLISPKYVSQDLAATYVVKSGGDGFSFNTTINHKTKNDNFSSIDSMVKTNSLEDTDTFEADSMTESMLKSVNLEQTTDNENETASEELFVKTELRDKILKNQESSIPTNPENSLKPRKIDEKLNGNETSHCATPIQNSRQFPKRKISVFHRSFDIHTQEGEKNNGGSDTYRLTEHSTSIPVEKNKTIGDDDMELDLECMKMTLDKGKVMLNYRTRMEDSDSSDSFSPLKSMEVQHENSSLETVEANHPIIKKLNLAPTKLKLPKEIPPFGSFQKKFTTDKSNDDAKGKRKMLENPRLNENRDSKAEVTQETDAMKNMTLQMDSTKNETTHDESKIEDGISTNIQENCSTMEIIRPGDEIERGVTYRKAPNSRESNFSDYSLLSSTNNTNIDDRGLSSKLESVSKVVLSFDDESTSCDSSPKREPSIIEITPTLASTYEKREIGGRLYSREDPTKCRVSSWQDRSTEAGSGYQTRNDSVTSYGVSEGVVGQDETVANIRTPTVGRAMSSGEDSSDSECDPMAIRRDDNDRRNVVNETRTISPNVGKFVNGALLVSSTPAASTTNIIVKNDVEIIECETRNGLTQKRDKRERTIRRSLSESGCGRSECRRHLSNDCSPKDEFTKEETRPTVFPSLTDIRLQESGIANLPNDEIGKNLPEADLERKYTAFSIGLVTDRVTLPRRMALSIRQRDQSERNLACEVYKMHQDIQDLAPLCRDRESVERVERVRHQLEMITQCAHRVSCTAETLGAVHQEHRISRAVLLADRYLLILRSRCEKLALDLAETKRILTENNIVVEEHNGELGDDMPRIRYRGMPTNNRTMMARRRASIATIFRPLGNFQDVTKDGLRQRNSVSGRVTLRRPSLTAESQKWEVEKLDRTDSSSSSIGELREIFEQAESRRNSREENNNNVLRLHSSNLNVRECENSETDVWTSPREEITSVPELSVDPTGCQDSTLGHKTSLPCWSTSNHFPWKTIIWCIVISFFFGFYVNHAVSSVNECSRTHFKWWSIEEIAERYLPIKNDAPRPI